MPHPRNPFPSHRLDKPSGQPAVKLTRPDSTRRSVYLGAYNSPESKRGYQRVLAALTGSPVAALTLPAARTGAAPDPTVNELQLAYLRHAATYYRRSDGSPATELKNYRDALRPLKALFGHTPTGEFGPLSLKAVRRVKRVFKWAAAEELIPFEVYHRLTASAGLGKGRAAGSRTRGGGA